MKHPNKYVGILLSLWIFLMISGCGKSKPHSRVFIKEAGYSIIPPTGWEEGRKAPPDIQKLNDKVGRRYIRSSQKGYRYQDLYGFGRMRAKPRLNNRIKSIDGDMTYYDLVEYNNIRGSEYDFTRYINHGDVWFNIVYHTYTEKLKVGKGLLDSGVSKKILNSILSFQIEDKKTLDKVQ